MLCGGSNSKRIDSKVEHSKKQEVEIARLEKANALS